MAKETTEYVYYHKNVSYFINVRMDIRDAIGRLLTAEFPDIAVDVDKLRDFKMANKRAITEGLILPIAEPSLDWETTNALEDEEIRGLVKNYMSLKARLTSITSLSILEKILNIAKEENKSPKILTLITNRIEEVAPEIDDPSLLQGVE